MRGPTAGEERTNTARTRQRTEERDGQTRGVQQNISEDRERQAEEERGQRRREFTGVSQQENGKTRRGAVQVERHNLSSLIIYHHIPLDILLSPQTWTMSRSAKRPCDEILSSSPSSSIISGGGGKHIGQGSSGDSGRRFLLRLKRPKQPTADMMPQAA